MKQKLFTFLIALVASANMMFADYHYETYEGMQFELNDATLQATLLSCDPSVSGAVVIPEIVPFTNEDEVTSYYTVTQIGWAHGVFNQCPGITSISLPASVRTIGAHAFRESSLQSVVIPEGVREIHYGAFLHCESLLSVNLPNSIDSIAYDAFLGCTSLQSVVLPNSLKAIEDGTFASCYSLTSIEIPNSVTRIGEDYFLNGAFSSCTSLSSVTLSKNLKQIGARTFSDCSALEEIVIPNSVVEIDKWAFSDCANLKAVTLSENISKIDTGTFYYCQSLESINIPAGITSIESSAFYLTNLDNIVLPDGLKKIGEFAFHASKSLKEIEIPNSVTNIEYRAFGQCDALERVVLSDNLDSISAETFIFCYALKSVHIPDNVKIIGKNAFHNCYSLQEISLPNKLQSIGDKCFAWCSGLQNVEIPNDIEIIGDSAYWGCYNLDTVRIGSGIEQIKGGVFLECYNLKRVYVDAMTPPQVGAKLFNQTNPEVVVPCGSLEKYEKTDWKDYNIQYEPIMHDYDYILGDKSVGIIDARSNVCDPTVVVITFIPNSGYGFLGWSDGNKDNPREVNVGEEVTFTPEYAVVNSGKCGDDWLLTWEYEPETKTLTISGEGTLNSNYTYGAVAPQEMEHLIIEDGVTSIGDDAFYNCYTLTSIDIPNSVTYIGWNTFAYCSNVTSLEIPSSVNTIGGWAFYGWHGLTSVTIPNSVTDLGRSAFGYCLSLTEIIVAEDHPMYCSVDGVLYNKDQTEILGFPAGRGGSYTLPASVTRIGYGVFADCYDLTSLIIPNGVTSIGEDAFGACNGLTTITIPSSVTTIEGYAFYYCAGLKSFTSEATTPSECGENAFYGVDKTIPLYVPAESVDAYKAAEGWSEFENILPIQAEEVPVVEIQAVPTYYSVVLSWPSVVDAETYTIVIKKGTETFCTLTFNELGQLLNIAFAPSRNGNRNNNQPRMALQTLTGWQYAITGLEPNTEYVYIVTTTKTDHSEEVQSMSFTTKQTPTGIDEIDASNTQPVKLLKQGQLYILRDGAIFNAQGARIR